MLRPLSRLVRVLPFLLLATGCSDDDVEVGDDPVGGAGTSGGTQSGAGAGGDGSTAGTSGSGAGSGAGGGDAGSGSGGNGTAGTAGTAGTGGSGGAATGGGGSDGLATGPSPVGLGTAANFVILAQTGITNVPTSDITGDLGLSPAAGSYVTGFALTRAGTEWTAAEVTGSVFSADNDPPTPSNLTTAVADMGTAYEDAANRPTPGFLNLADGAIGGRTLLPGLYKWTSSVTIPADLTIAGAASDSWIFQITGDLELAAGQQMTLSGGARARNIVWQVAGEVNLGSTSHAEGIILSKTAINLGNGASVNGRLLAQTAVALQGSTIVGPAQ